MVLEATVICVDNSDWMRNGDYTPTRWEAQQDAVNLLSGAKTQQNPESSVGVIAMGGRSPEVLVTLTTDVGKILSTLHGVKIGGNLNFVSGLQVAQLALKHRQNKNQHQRIVAFVGSPITEDTDELVRLAKRLKKNNIAVDIVNFGEQDENTQKLEAFIAAVNSNSNSHLVTIPPGPHILSDILISTPIVTGEEGGGGGTSDSGSAAPASSAGHEFGFDPNLDPELALALKLSMEEARSAAEKEAKSKAEADKSQSNPSTSTSAPSSSNAPSSTNAPSSSSTSSSSDSKPREVEMTDVDDDELKQALALSMAAAPTPTPAPSVKQEAPTKPPESKPASSGSGDVPMKEIDEDEEMQLALKMSMLSEGQKPSSTPTNLSPSSEADIDTLMEDPEFVNSVLSSLPGVDPNDQSIRNALKSLEKPKQEDKDKDKDKDKK